MIKGPLHAITESSPLLSPSDSFTVPTNRWSLPDKERRFFCCGGEREKPDVGMFTPVRQLPHSHDIDIIGCALMAPSGIHNYRASLFDVIL